MSETNRNNGSSTVDRNPNGTSGLRPASVQIAANGNNEADIYQCCAMHISVIRADSGHSLRSEQKTAMLDSGLSTGGNTDWIFM